MTAIEIGVISDTHGVLREEAISALQGVDVIIHAGDIGKPEVIDQLAEIAPLNAIRGNIDNGAWADVYPDHLSLEISRQRFHIVHDITTLDIDPMRDDVDVIICGHSHKPRVDYDQQLLLLNPGSAGPRRFRLPICLAKITIKDGALIPRIIELV